MVFQQPARPRQYPSRWDKVVVDGPQLSRTSDAGRLAFFIAYDTSHKHTVPLPRQVACQVAKTRIRPVLIAQICPLTSHGAAYHQKIGCRNRCWRPQHRPVVPARKDRCKMGVVDKKTRCSCARAAAR